MIKMNNSIIIQGNNQTVIQDSKGNIIIQGGNNSVCIINGKKYVNGIEVEDSNTKSKETLMWEDVISMVERYIRNTELTSSGKMIAKYTKSDLLKDLKHKYFIDEMKHKS